MTSTRRDKLFGEAIADCLRGMMRPGMDSTAYDMFMLKMSKALTRIERIREMQEQENSADDKYIEMKAEADALAKEWSVLLVEDEKMWTKIDGWKATKATTPKEGAAKEEKEKKEMA